MPHGKVGKYLPPIGASGMPEAKAKPSGKGVGKQEAPVAVYRSFSDTLVNNAEEQDPGLHLD